MDPKKVTDKATKAQLSRTVRGLAGRLDHVETLLAAKPLRARIEEVAQSVNTTAATLTDLIQNLIDRVGKLEAALYPAQPPDAIAPLAAEDVDDLRALPADAVPPEEC